MMEDEDMIDMEQEVHAPIVGLTVQELSEYLQGLDYSRYSPQALTMIRALAQQYDPAKPPDRQVQYCQMQFSSLADGGGTGSVLHRRVITHTGDRVIGHNLAEQHFTEVLPSARIHLEGLTRRDIRYPTEIGQKEIEH